MRKTLFFSIFFIMHFFVYAQDVVVDPQWNGSSTSTGNIYRSGNVGIGNISPSEKLDVTGNIKAEKGNFIKSWPNGTVFASYGDRNLKCNVLRAGTVLAPEASLFNFLDFPSSNFNPQAQSFVGVEDRNYKSRFRFYANTGGSSEQLYYDKTQTTFYSLSEDGTGNVYLKLPKENSYVSIGTDSYQDGADIYRLSVNGRVRAESVKVYTDWADFVFEKDYYLPSLKEVEEQINNYGHLKDIPSASEVEKNGIDLGEMNKLLLQKIEELTLYLIQKEKQINELTESVIKLEKKMDSID